MSFAAGLLGGLADGANARKDREQRRRELSVMEALAARGGPATAGQQGEGYYKGQGAVSGGAADALNPQAFSYNGQIGDRPAHAYKRFISAGLPPHISAGLVGNLMQESGADINPAAVGDNGNAFGAGQWNGPRRRAYFDFAKQRGADPSDFDAQIDWLLHEGRTSEKGAWGRIMQAKNAEEAALLASKHFWRPGAPHNEARMGYAQKIYSTLGTSQAPAEASQPQQQATGAWSWFQKRVNGGAQ